MLFVAVQGAGDLPTPACKLASQTWAELLSALSCRLLNTFQSTLDEVSIIALPAQQSTAGTGGQAAAQRCVKLQSFYDPAKGKAQHMHALHIPVPR